MTAAINYYRANVPNVHKENVNNLKDDGENGLYILGENDAYISRTSCKVVPELYPKAKVEIVAGANHFVQQVAPKETNKIIRNFIGSSSQYKVQPFY